MLLVIPFCITPRFDKSLLLCPLALCELQRWLGDTGREQCQGWSRGAGGW